MSGFKKLVRKMEIWYVILMIAMFVICLINQPGSIPGVCDECSAGTSNIFAFATMIFIILAGLAIAKFCVAWNVNSKGKTVAITTLSIISIVFLAIMFLLFLGSPDVRTHDEITEKSIRLIDMLDVQFVLAKIFCVVLAIMNFVMTKILKYGYDD